MIMGFKAGSGKQQHVITSFKGTAQKQGAGERAAAKSNRVVQKQISALRGKKS
jgi:hypothetical protein